MPSTGEPHLRELEPARRLAAATGLAQECRVNRSNPRIYVPSARP